MTTTGSVQLVDLADLLPLIPGTTLGNATIDLSLVKAEVKTPFSADAGTELKFVVQAGGELTMRVINEGNPQDPDRIVAATGTTTPSGELPPQVLLTKDHAWVKYRAEAQASAAASVDAGWFGAEVNASGQVVGNDYRRHDKDAFAVSAIQSDITKGPRFAISLKDVLDLDPGDAVSFHVGGELLVRVSVSWSDVFTSQLGTLTRVIRSTAPVGIKSTLAAKVQASVKLSDQFILAFSRLDDATWGVGVKKAAAKEVDIGAEVGVTVEIDNKDEITRMLNDLVGELLGKAFDEITALLAKSSFSHDDVEKFAEVFRRLGLGTAPSSADLRQALERFQSDVTQRIATLVKEKISLGFAYEYRRVSTDTMLLQAVVTRSALEAHHSELKRGQLKGVIDSALGQRSQDEGPIVIKQFLNEKKVSTERAWGFTLGIGKWKLSGRDRRSPVAVRRVTLDGLHEQRSYTGLGEYEGNVFGEKQSWHVDLTAETPQFSIGRVPCFNEYQFGLNLGWDETNRTFDRSDLEQALDFATLWGISAQRDEDTVRTMLEPFLDKKGVEWSLHLRINNDALRAIAPVIAASDRTQFAGPMAAAMRARDGVGGIVGVARRRELYEPVWLFYLHAQDAPSPAVVSQVAQNHLRREAPISATQEELFAKRDGLLTAAGTCALNPDTRSNADDFVRGMQTLALGISRNDADVNAISSIYTSMVKLWTQSHHVRALGVRFVDVARDVGQLKGVERTLTATLEGTSVTISSNPSGTT